MTCGDESQPAQAYHGRSGGIEKFVRWKSKKNSEKKWLTTDQADRCGQATAKGDRSEAMLSTPALSGEWEVPVTRNARSLQ